MISWSVPSILCSSAGSSFVPNALRRPARSASGSACARQRKAASRDSWKLLRAAALLTGAFAITG